MAMISEVAAYTLTLTYDEAASLKNALKFIANNTFCVPHADDVHLDHLDDHLDHDTLADIVSTLDMVI